MTDDEIEARFEAIEWRQAALVGTLKIVLYGNRHKAEEYRAAIEADLRATGGEVARETLAQFGPSAPGADVET